MLPSSVFVNFTKTLNKLVVSRKMCCQRDKISVLAANSAEHLTTLLRDYLCSGRNFQISPEKDNFFLKYGCEQM